jgi:hypothetical protein
LPYGLRAGLSGSRPPVTTAAGAGGRRSGPVGADVAPAAVGSGEARGEHDGAAQGLVPPGAAARGRRLVGDQVGAVSAGIGDGGDSQGCGDHDDYRRASSGRREHCWCRRRTSGDSRATG